MSPGAIAKLVIEGVDLLKSVLDQVDEAKRDELHMRINRALVDSQAHMRELAQAALDER